MVRDSLTRELLQGVQVELFATVATISSTATAADGSFRFDHIPAGSYKIRCLLPGYRTPQEGQSTVSVRVQAAVESVNIGLEPASSVSGVVLDEDGHPMDGVSVYAGSSLMGTTDAEGRYQVGPLRPGNVVLAYRIPLALRLKTLQHDSETGETFGYNSSGYYPGTADLQAATKTSISGSLQLNGFDIRLRRVRLVKVSGRLVERVGGEPLIAAKVSLEPTSSGFIDDGLKFRDAGPNGEFQFEWMPPGRYMVAVYRTAGDNRLPYLTPIDIPKTGLEDLTVSVPPFPLMDAVVRVAEDAKWTGLVRVKLVSAASPMQSLEVVVKESPFSLGEIPPGIWRVEIESTAALVDKRRLGAAKAQFGAFDGLTQELTFAESGNPPLEIRLEANLGTISGTLVGEDGKPAGRSMLMYTSAAAEIRKMKVALTNADGSFLVEGVPAGRYRIGPFGSFGTGDFVGLDRGAKGLTSVEVKAGETTVVQLRQEKK